MTAPSTPADLAAAGGSDLSPTAPAAPLPAPSPDDLIVRARDLQADFLHRSARRVLRRLGRLAAGLAPGHRLPHAQSGAR